GICSSESEFKICYFGMKPEKKMSKKPTLPRKIDGKEYVMLGPFNQGKPFQYPLEEQEEIDKKLRKKLKKKFRKKYKMYR
ncbi:MAG: hypothetical protein ACOC87_04280, partial [Candidatus Natronoplasma sp.]